ncbi:hypothetical protein QYE76_016435 [Lolium multiflorum]|uniref:PDZ domain-containing protein n=1 Tax=Lolium multiflorum TaxID=4521 RepID=A0AAD8VDA9_LOLMU|nr:hypothetical protein QYE76_016435 [Lolium multiflorum]
MPTATSEYRLPSQAPSSERSERKRKRRRRRRRSIKVGEETSTEDAVTRISEDEEKETKKKREDEDEEVVSSAPSSPLYEPCLPDDDPDPPPELIEAFERAQSNYEIKRGNLRTELQLSGKARRVRSQPTRVRIPITRCIPRPQLGLAFSGIKLLDIVQVDKIWRKYKIDDGLIVNEVLKGSQAEEIGIRRGDIIECFNGQCISTTVQLENLLLSLCKSAGNGRDSKIHVSLEVFHVRKYRRKIRKFSVGVSEHREFIGRAYKPVTLD